MTTETTTPSYRAAYSMTRESIKHSGQSLESYERGLIHFIMETTHPTRADVEFCKGVNAAVDDVRAKLQKEKE